MVNNFGINGKDLKRTFDSESTQLQNPSEKKLRTDDGQDNQADNVNNNNNDITQQIGKSALAAFSANDNRSSENSFEAQKLTRDQALEECLKTTITFILNLGIPIDTYLKAVLTLENADAYCEMLLELASSTQNKVLAEEVFKVATHLLKKRPLEISGGKKFLKEAFNQPWFNDVTLNFTNTTTKEKCTLLINNTLLTLTEPFKRIIATRDWRIAIANPSDIENFFKYYFAGIPCTPNEGYVELKVCFLEDFEKSENEIKINDSNFSKWVKAAFRNTSSYLLDEIAKFIHQSKNKQPLLKFLLATYFSYLKILTDFKHQSFKTDFYKKLIGSDHQILAEIIEIAIRNKYTIILNESAIYAKSSKLDLSTNPKCQGLFKAIFNQQGFNDRVIEGRFSDGSTKIFQFNSHIMELNDLEAPFLASRNNSKDQPDVFNFSIANPVEVETFLQNLQSLEQKKLTTPAEMEIWACLTGRNANEDKIEASINANNYKDFARMASQPMQRRQIAEYVLDVGQVDAFLGEFPDFLSTLMQVVYDQEMSNVNTEMVDKANFTWNSLMRVVYARGLPTEAQRKDFHALVSKTFNHPNFSDHTLIVNGEKIYVNKSVLAISSDFFKSLFFTSQMKENNQEETQCSDTFENNKDVALIILNFLYSNEFKSESTNIDSLMLCYKILKGLLLRRPLNARPCLELLSSNLSFENIQYFLEFATFYGLRVFLDKIKQFVRDNFSQNLEAILELGLHIMRDKDSKIDPSFLNVVQDVFTSEINKTLKDGTFSSGMHDLVKKYGYLFKNLKIEYNVPRQDLKEIIRFCPNLVSLSIHSWWFDDTDLGAIASLKLKLKKLDLSSSKVKGFKKGKLDSFSSLETLILGSCLLDLTKSAAILEKLENLKSLSLGKIATQNPEAVRVFVEALCKLKKLEFLDLGESSCNVGHVDWPTQEVLNKLIPSLPNLKELHFVEKNLSLPNNCNSLTQSSLLKIMLRDDWHRTCTWERKDVTSPFEKKVENSVKQNQNQQTQNPNSNATTNSNNGPIGGQPVTNSNNQSHSLALRKLTEDLKKHGFGNVSQKGPFQQSASNNNSNNYNVMPPAFVPSGNYPNQQLQQYPNSNTATNSNYGSIGSQPVRNNNNNNENTAQQRHIRPQGSYGTWNLVPFSTEPFQPGNYPNQQLQQYPNSNTTPNSNYGSIGSQPVRNNNNNNTTYPVIAQSPNSSYPTNNNSNLQQVAQGGTATPNNPSIPPVMPPMLLPNTDLYNIDSEDMRDE